jgi:hypothetical protein
VNTVLWILSLAGAVGFIAYLARKKENLNGLFLLFVTGGIGWAIVEFLKNK